jgi:hypothetical protein
MAILSGHVPSVRGFIYTIAAILIMVGFILIGLCEQITMCHNGIIVLVVGLSIFLVNTIHQHCFYNANTS